jgi:GT2 family glycosyltransferase
MDRNEGAPSPVVVVIATRPGREGLLRRRALPSVLAQTLRPVAVVVVDDAARPIPSELTEALHAWPFEETGLRVEVLPNNRTRGMSGTGAWNTGAHRAAKLLPEGGWLAILDDDDAWLPNYLERCLAAAEEVGAGLVVSGLLRISSSGVERQLAPVDLTPSLFFLTNPGIQGSNIFVAVDLFLAVGGFDEGLASTTDRDLLIRLLDHMQQHPWPVARVEDWLVEHHAHDDERVTTDLAAKHRGLDGFYERHRHRMAPEELSASLDRARLLFGYLPSWVSR